MPSSISEMAGSSKQPINQRLINDLLPRTAHSTIICGQTRCGKTVFVLDLLEGPFRGVFRYIISLFPTIRHNDIPPTPMDLGRPWYLRSRPRRAPAWLLASLLPGIPRWAHPIYHRRLLGHEGFDQEERHVVRASILGPPRRPKCLGPHPEVQLRSERLERADALGRLVSLQG